MKKKLFLVCMLVFSISSVYAETTWTTGAYENNVNISKELSIPGASNLTVTVEGETESSYDFIWIYDQNGVLKKKLHGFINASFDVEGPSITAQLTSDGSQTREGVTVTVTESAANHTKVKTLVIPMTPSEDWKEVVVAPWVSLSMSVSSDGERGFGLRNSSGKDIFVRSAGEALAQNFFTVAHGSWTYLHVNVPAPSQANNTLNLTLFENNGEQVSNRVMTINGIQTSTHIAFTITYNDK